MDSGVLRACNARVVQAVLSRCGGLRAWRAPGHFLHPEIDREAKVTHACLCFVVVRKTFLREGGRYLHQHAGGHGGMRGARKVDRLTVQLTMWVILSFSSRSLVLATLWLPTKIVPLPSPPLHSDRASAR